MAGAYGNHVVCGYGYSSPDCTGGEITPSSDSLTFASAESPPAVRTIGRVQTVTLTNTGTARPTSSRPLRRATPMSS